MSNKVNTNVPITLIKLFSNPDAPRKSMRSYKVGSLHFPTGNIVVCDPILTGIMEPFRERAPSPTATVWKHVLPDEEAIAYVEVRFQEKVVDHWAMAVTKAQDSSLLKKGEIFGFPVESNIAAIMDAATLEHLNATEVALQNQKGDSYQGIFDEILLPHFRAEENTLHQDVLFSLTEGSPTIYAFESGYGEGFYASYFGIGADGRIVKLIIELIEPKIN